MNGEEVQIRFMNVQDVEEIMDIEQASFTTPWTAEAYRHELLYNRLACYLVAEIEGEIVGYCGLWIIIDEAHITNIAVHPAYRGRHLGEQLMRAAMAIALSQGAHKMTLEVRVSNIVAQSLYKKLGFVETGIRKGYYSDNQEDALIMWVMLDES